MKSILKICDKYDGIDYRKPQCFERVKEVVIINDTEMLSFRIVLDYSPYSGAGSQQNLVGRTLKRDLTPRSSPDG